MVALILYY